MQSFYNGPYLSKERDTSVQMLWLPNNFSNIFNPWKQATVKSGSIWVREMFILAKLPLAANGMVTKFHFDIETFEKADIETNKMWK